MYVRHYVLAIEGGINPDLSGPYTDEAERDEVGRTIHAAQDPACDSTYAIDVAEDGTLSVENSAFGDGEDDDA